MIKKLLAGAAIAAASTTAWADGELDVRYAFGDYEADSSQAGKAETESDGYELRAQIKPGDKVFFRVELLNTTTDDVDVNGQTVNVSSDVSTTRLGLGYEFDAGGLVPYGVLEYGRIKADATGFGSDADSGAILSVGVRDNRESMFLWNAEVGYLNYTDSDGFVAEANLGIRAGELLAFVVGYQHYDIETDNFTYGGFNGSFDLEVPTITAGIRLEFGT